MKQMKKWVSLLLTAVLVLTLTAPAALAAESTVYIETAADLLTFSQQCTLDTWSQGKTVILKNDLDLSSVDFQPIPTFGGTFQGNDHTISGLQLGGSGNVRGLFRYLQSSATVQDLNVSGTIHPSDRQNNLGLLAGNNAGRIINCHTHGTVVGDNRIGGVVGVNEAGGELIGCTFHGSITGKHSVGGVVGENHGTLTRCENSGSINTKDLEDNPKTDYTDLTQLNSMENVPAYTDVGGVVGLSDGTVQSCTNSGAVGYDQIGYNIGGVAGRSSGWLDGCTNTGAVAGRRDVGGVVGQLGPEILKTFSEDFLDRLLAQMDDLQDVLDRTANHADGISDSVHSQMNDLSDKARSVKEIASDLTDAMTDWANGNIDQINELSARISWSLDQLDDIMSDAEDMVDDLDDLVDELESVRQPLANAAGNGVDANNALQDTISGLRQANRTFQRTLPKVAAALAGLANALANGADPDETLDALNELGYQLQGFENALDQLDEAMQRLNAALDDLSSLGVNLKKAIDRMEDVNDAMEDLVDSLSNVTYGLRDMIHELSQKPDITIDPIGTDITDKGDALSDAMDALMDSGDALNQLISDSADTLIADMKAINSQFRAITNLIRSEKSDWESDRSKSLEDQIKDHFQDASDTCDLAKQHDGRVSNCENSGTVNGNSHIGGVVGTVGIETDLDVDDDVTKVGDYSLDFHYQARALVYACVNRGTVSGRNDGAGGVVGWGYLGRVTGCEGYGAVSTDGSYAGGLVGSTEGSVDSGWAKCPVTAADYVGGIAGYADSMTACRALPTVTGDAYAGAVAGDVGDDGTVSGNLFTSETLGGIDGVSYAGIAEPVDFDTLCAQSGVPKSFTQLELTFRADGEVVAVVPFQYGRGIDALPEIPAKKGCSASWPELDYTCLTASQTLDAVYTPYASALTDGTGDLPEILVDGSFGANATVSHTSQSVSWTDAKGVTRSGTAVTVTVEDPDFKEITYTVHYRLPESGKRYDLWVETENGWEKQDATVDGSYLLFASTQSAITFCVLQRQTNPLLWVALAAAAVLLLLAVAALIARKRGRPLHSRLKRLKRSKAAAKK